MDMLLAYGPGAAEAFEAAAKADDRLAVAHAGRALVAVAQGDAATARAATEKAREGVGGATRRERQHGAALRALGGGETTRGLRRGAGDVAGGPRDAVPGQQRGR